jgi:hypothetical protein
LSHQSGAPLRKQVPTRSADFPLRMSQDAPLFNVPTIVVTVADGTLFTCTAYRLADASHASHLRWKLTDAAGRQHVGPRYLHSQSPNDVQQLVGEWWESIKTLGLGVAATPVAEPSPLDEIRAAWPRIVREWLARHSQPTALSSDGTLVVTSRLSRREQLASERGARAVLALSSEAFAALRRAGYSSIRAVRIEFEALE